MDEITIRAVSQEGTASMVDGSALNLDALLVQNCRLYFPLLPEVQFFLQTFSMPDVSVNEIKQTTRFVDPNQIGEKLNFQPFTVTFVVDNKFKNWAAIFNWMKAMTVGGSVVDKIDNPVLIINGEDTLQFQGAWPTALGGFQMNSTDPSARYVVCNLTLNYDYVDYKGSFKTVDSAYK